jgi:Zn-dependent peptidase ImmA (M78 family)
MHLVDLYNTETKIKAEQTMMDAFTDFLPMAMKYLKINSLPSIKLEKNIVDSEHPTFGRFVNEENKIYIAINDRQPIDILRTLAHELVHYKQGTEHNLGPDSGETGSPIENEAHAEAGIMMRQFNAAYPEYLKAKPIIEV